MNLLSFLIAALFSTTLLADGFSALKTKYSGAESLEDRDLLLNSAWTGTCFTVAQSDQPRSALLTTYSATDPYRFPFAHLVFAGSIHSSEYFEEMSPEEIKDIATSKQKYAWPISLYFNEAAWIQGRGYESVTIRATKDTNGELNALFTLSKCLADADTCKYRGTAAGEWRYCEFLNRRI